MKNVLFLILIMLLSSFVPADGTGLDIDFTLIMTVLVAIYEAVSRIIPTTKMWSIIGKLLELLTWLSNLLNRKKK